MTITKEDLTESFSLDYYVLLPIAGLMGGLLIDTFLDQRWGVVVGFMSIGLGFFLLGTHGGSWSLPMAGACLMVGFGTGKVAKLAYFGNFIRTQGFALEGGYALFGLAFSLAAILTGLAITFLLDQSQWLVGGLMLGTGALSIAIGVVWMAGILMGWLPDSQMEIPNPSRNRKIGALGIILLVPVMMGLTWLLHIIPFKNFGLVLVSASLLAVIGGFIYVFRQPGINVARRNAILAVLLLGQMLNRTMMGIWYNMNFLQNGSSDLLSVNGIQNIGLAVFGIALGALLLLVGSGKRRDLGGNGVGMLVGIGLQVLFVGLGPIIVSIFPDSVVIVIFLLLISGLGDTLWSTFANGTMWRLSPPQFRTTTFALFMAMPSLGVLWIQDRPMDIGGKPILGLGIWEITILAVGIGLAVGLWALLRNDSQSVEVFGKE
ncbi:MAG: hypothetical protein U0176_02835 [Bacteroidia bacterium]